MEVIAAVLAPIPRRTAATLALFLAMLMTLWAAPTAARETEPGEVKELEDGILFYQSGDFVNALDRLKPLAVAGVHEAQFYMGFMSAQGLGEPTDPVVAAKWYKRAALQGHIQAQNYLGLMYFEGNGVPRDFRKAFIFFELAAIGGNQDAINNRLIVARKMSSKQITDAQKEAGRLISLITDEGVDLPTQMSSGVVITNDGLILTHLRAINECGSVVIRVDEQPLPGVLVVADEFNGLALIRADIQVDSPAVFRGLAVEIGEIVSVVGFTLDRQLLGELVTVEATVTSTAGIERVDDRYFQIDAGLDSASLGAPVFDVDGRLVGIVETNLPIKSIAKITGQHEVGITFAVRENLARLLLSMNDIAFETEIPAPVAEGSVYDQITGNNVVAVECWKGGA